MKLKDAIWIWGHPANSLYGNFGIDKQAFVSPVEGMYQLGARNIFYVPMRNVVEKQRCSQEMQDVRCVGWALENTAQNPAEIQELIELAKQYPNICCGIFDDFFNEENVQNNWTNYTVERLLEIREKLHQADLEMWVVLYAKQLEWDIEAYLNCFDGVSMWFWCESETEALMEQQKRFFHLTPTQKRLMGVYLYNFGEKKPANPQNVVRQLQQYRKDLQAGCIDGIILHTNAVCDMGFSSVEAAAKWTAQHGEEELPQRY